VQASLPAGQSYFQTILKGNHAGLRPGLAISERHRELPNTLGNLSSPLQSEQVHARGGAFRQSWLRARNDFAVPAHVRGYDRLQAPSTATLPRARPAPSEALFAVGKRELALEYLTVYCEPAGQDALELGHAPPHGGGDERNGHARCVLRSMTVARAQA
jgi:hypothetical protein